jgi:hypothetical protein
VFRFRHGKPLRFCQPIEHARQQAVDLVIRILVCQIFVNQHALLLNETLLVHMFG